MAYYRDLRDFLAALDRAGKLVRVTRQINKDTELHPLVRLQFRGLPEWERKAFIFDNVTDSTGRVYRGSVATCVAAASREMYALGLQCQPAEIADKWVQSRVKPIPPRLVTSGTAQEEVHLGDKLLEHGGLAEFPLTICTPGYDVAPYFTAPCWVSKDPETGAVNVGTYRAQVKSPTCTAVMFGRPSQHMAQHWQKCRKLGKPLQAALVQGVAPHMNYVSVAKLAYGESEYGVAGRLVGEPVELIKCLTVDLEVPAHAEMVIEGEVSLTEVEPEGPFGENWGYMGHTTTASIFNVKCITHRKNPIVQSFFSEFPPSESITIRGIARSASLFTFLRHDLGMSQVLSVAIPDDTSATGVVVIGVKHGTEQDKVWAVLEKAFENLAKETIMVPKLIIAVDDDIDPHDPGSVLWALSFRMQPYRDIRVRTHPAESFTEWGTIDPSIVSFDDIAGKASEFARNPPPQSKMLMNATMKWDYPPLSLPKKEFMDNAIKLWQEMKLPPLKLREPWWGRNYGVWTDQEEVMANLATQGRWQEVGEMIAKRRKVIE